MDNHSMNTFSLIQYLFSLFVLQRLGGGRAIVAFGSSPPPRFYLFFQPSSLSLRSDCGAKKKKNLSFALITMVALHWVLYMTKIEPLRFCWNLSSHQAQLRFQHPTIPVSWRSLESFSCLRHHVRFNRSSETCRRANL